MNRTLTVLTFFMLSTASIAADGDREFKPVLTILDAEELARLTKALPSAKKHVVCMVGGVAYRCTAAPPAAACGKLRFLAPLPLGDTDYKPCDTVSPQFAWAAPDAVQGGKRRLAELRIEADEAVPTCPDSCWTTFHTNAVKSSDGYVEGLARCRIRTHQGKVGAPEACMIVAVNDGKSWRLRGVLGYDDSLGFGSIPDFDLSFYSTSTIEVGAILSAVREKLQLQPLLLEADPARVVAPLPRAAQTVIAIGAPRWSPPLGEWTWSSVRIDRYAPPQLDLAYSLGSPYRLHSEFLVTVDLLVNRYNTKVVKDWHRPTESEIRDYVEDVKVALGNALKQQCIAAKWVDNRTLLCRTPR